MLPVTGRSKHLQRRQMPQTAKRKNAMEMTRRRAPVHKRLSLALTCTAYEAEFLGLRWIARKLYGLSFYVAYREWRKPAVP